MKTKHYLLLLVLLTLKTAYSQTNIFEENFNKPSVTVLWNGGSFTINETTNHYDSLFNNNGWSGIEMAKGATDSGNKIAAKKPRVGWWSGMAYLTSPTIDLSSKPNYTVKFQLRNNARNAEGSLLDYDKMLFLHAPDGENFVVIDTISGMTLDVQEYTRVISNGTENSKLRFSRVHATENAPNRFFVFKVLVEEGNITDIDNLLIKNDKIEFYPNPVNVELNIKSEDPICSISIFDITGRSVLSFNNPGEKINLISLAAGNYILQAQRTNGETTQFKLNKN